MGVRLFFVTGYVCVCKYVRVYVCLCASCACGHPRAQSTNGQWQPSFLKAQKLIHKVRARGRLNECVCVGA